MFNSTDPHSAKDALKGDLIHDRADAIAGTI
jgi:hypothetical protein